MKCKFCNEECVKVESNFNYYACGKHDMIILYWVPQQDITFFIDRYEFSFILNNPKKSYTVLFQHEVVGPQTYEVFDGITIDKILYESMGFHLDVNLPKQVAIVDCDFNLNPNNVRYYIQKLLKMSVFS